MPAAPRQRGPGRRSAPAILALALLGTAAPAEAGTFVPAGDAALRADIQHLADYGLISGPVTTWPLSWAPIAAELEAAGEDELPGRVSAALARVRAAARRETRRGELRAHAAVAGAEKPSRIRSFAATPREAAEVRAGLDWAGERIVLALDAQLVDSPDDGRKVRGDNSLLGVTLGNFVLGAGTLDRWWGPGWDGSLILSSNARPIPALTLDRRFTGPFETPWLRWLGPWDLSVAWGRLESAREVPRARFFGMRVAFRPLSSLEIGLSRTAQWCGEGRPCGFDTFLDLLAGRDNRGDAGVGAENEPGNQMAGADFRWSLAPFGLPIAFYGQLVGEDEAGGLPSRLLAQAGLEGLGDAGERWSYRWFGEVVDTSCGFYESDDNFDCAYHHGTYRTGYRYRGRAIGHGADNDARLVTAGLMLFDDAGRRLSFLARFGELNRGGVADPRHSLTPVPQDLASFDVAWSRDTRFGVLELGAGVERAGTTDYRGFLRWRTP